MKTLTETITIVIVLTFLETITIIQLTQNRYQFMIKDQYLQKKNNLNKTNKTLNKIC